MVTNSAMEVEPSWHDDPIYGFRIESADIDAGDFRSVLVFDIDHIVDWVCEAGQPVMFKVAPATLAFHDVGALCMNIDFGASGFTNNIIELVINSISKARRPAPGAMPEREFYLWRIALNVPSNGEITFGASRYSLELRAEPILVAEQRRPISARTRLPHTNSTATPHKPPSKG